MPAPVLDEINDVAEQLVETVDRSKSGWRSLWEIEGPPAAGKSACLARAAELIGENTDLTPILVAPPPHHLDAAAVAMTDVVVGLADGGVINGELKSWTEEPGSWLSRITDLQGWIGDHQDDLVLLFDAPATWGSNRDEDNFFRRRGSETALALTSLHCRRVIAGSSTLPIEPSERFTLAHPKPEPGWLANAEAWGELAGAAASLVETDLFTRAATPLSVRLMVAAGALSSLEEVASWVPVRGPIEARALIDPLATLMRSDYPGFWQEWLRFSFTRRPFDAEVFDRLLSPRASALERDLTRHCLLFGEDMLHMHDALKLAALRWRRDNSAASGLTSLRRKANQTLFEVHRDRFQRLTEKGSPRALTESMEAYHFASVLGGTAFVEEVAPLFVDQLDALGWSLSVEHRKFARAAKAFEAALQWDPEDDYAHHYLAYNLYRLGQRLDEVEAHFRCAVEIEPEHSWWRSRLISFMVDRGRIAEARELWEEAELALGLGESDLSTSTYEHLHCWVASALIEHGEPYLARRILNAVPEWARARIDSYDSLSLRADALLELGDGDAVVPGWRLRAGWWQFGPELLQARIGSGQSAKRLVRWLAGRVEAKDEDGLHIRTALIEDEESEPPISRTILTRPQYERFSRDETSFDELAAGSFIEIGLYSDPDTGRNPETILRILSERPWGPPSRLSAPPERRLLEIAASR